MDTPTSTSSELLTIGAVSRELERSESTIRKYDRLGILPSVRTSGNVRIFRRLDVDRLKSRLSGGNHAA